MPDVKVGTKEILGTKVDVLANGYGRFAIELDGTRLGSGETLEQATANARTQMNKDRVEIAVHFYTMDGRKGVATKIHAKTRNIIAKVSNKSEQLPNSQTVFKGDTPKLARDKYRKLLEQMRELRSEQRQIEQKYSMQIGNAVRKAIEEATSDA